jgi:hypothetical protein
MEKHFIQNLKYEKNSYYNSLNIINNFSVSDNIEILNLINSIDAVISFLIQPNLTYSKNKFQSLAGTYLSEFKNLLSERSKNDHELLENLMLIFETTVASVEKYIENMSNNLDYKKTNLINKTNSSLIEKISTIKENGYLEFEFEQSTDFLSWSEEQLNEARLKYSNESDWRGANSYDLNSKEFKFIQEFIYDQKILEIISAYKNMNMEIVYAAWDYSHNRQKWFRNNHEYDHLSPTNYFHYDADVDVAKMLIYLTDVNDGDGPFKFVKSSNTMPRSTFINYIYSAIDTKISPKFANKENLYGRGLFLYRKDLLMKMPYCIIGSTHFGDDLIEGSELSSYLLNHTVVFKRKKGTVVLFDGYKGIHAGGNAHTGERLAIQVAFRRSKSTKTPVSNMQSVKHLVKNILKNKLHLIK